MNWLLLELPEPEALHGPAATTVRWLRLRANGTPLDQGHGPADELRGLTGRGDRVLAVVPGERAPLYRTSLPPGSFRARRQALPYALEDRLSEDIDDLHFVAEPTRAPQMTAAVVAQRDLEPWRDWLQQHGLQQARLIPDIALLRGWAPDDTTLVLAGSRRAFVLEPDAEPLALPQELLGWWLQHREARAADDGDAAAAPHALRIEGGTAEHPPSATAGLQPATGDPALPADWDGSLLTLLHSACSTDPQRARSLARGLRRGAVLNLGSSAAATHSAGALLRPLRLPAGLAAAVAVLWLATLWLEFTQLEREIDRAEQEIATIFERALPGTRMVDPVAQFEAALGGDSATDTGATASALGRRLAEVAGVFGGNNGATTIRSLRGDATRLEIELQIASISELEALREQLSEQTGQGTRITRAETGEDGVRARIVVEEGR